VHNFRPIVGAAYKNGRALCQLGPLYAVLLRDLFAHLIGLGGINKSDTAAAESSTTETPPIYTFYCRSEYRF
jgi:hypothetical protein